MNLAKFMYVVSLRFPWEYLTFERVLVQGHVCGSIRRFEAFCKHRFIYRNQYIWLSH